MEKIFNVSAIASTVVALLIFLAIIYFVWGKPMAAAVPATTTGAPSTTTAP